MKNIRRDLRAGDLNHFGLNKENFRHWKWRYVCSKSSEFGVNFRLIQFMLSIFGNHPLGSHPGRDCLMKNFPSFSLFLHPWPACSVSLSHYVSKEESDTVGLLKTYQKYSPELLVMKAEYNVVALSSWTW